MSNHIKNHVLLVGSGKMAVEYAKVLSAIKQKYICVGRGEASCENFFKQTGIRPVSGGIHTYLKNIGEVPAKGIVAVPVEQLYPVTKALLHHGLNELLVEKPGGMDAGEIKELGNRAKMKQANVYVAYNRRFYASVEKIKEMVRQEGGVLSFHFDFTELSHTISTSAIHDKVKRSWLLANSSHIIDTAFYLGGNPIKLQAKISGKDALNWHPEAAIFTGCGETGEGALFSYNANWISPGRWGIQVNTEKSKLLLQPVEKLFIQKRGSFEVEQIALNNHLDLQFKPGLYNMVLKFLHSSHRNLVTIGEQYEHAINWYEPIADGGTF
ncbi:Gfo/Idh/MocA family oxidoreductase [Bacillus sp. H-16]|uniref:Gfo/Idh/MocA family protein n=1 Tax=Alteribacter salitolerans TaxID=2912333 RepID=UPI001966826D|nr:Gfo/Idh/MocA family oxidoreductase [Alteribacter salitolerans]MBM7094955.1 Gfo/Idh/MocA family oxidoreductase [Alteribacter salitolerans]